MKTAAALTAGIMLIGALVLALYLSMNFQNGHVQGNSMSPTLRDGDRMVSQRWGKDITSGTIVVLKAPGEDHEIVKRIIGLPGQTVMPPLALQPVTLAHGQYWVLGDNMPLSKDSRHFGPITKGQITGVVTHIRKMN